MSYFLAIIAVVLAALVVVKVFTNELNWREFWVLLGTTVTLAGFMIAVSAAIGLSGVDTSIVDRKQYSVEDFSWKPLPTGKRNGKRKRNPNRWR